MIFEKCHKKYELLQNILLISELGSLLPFFEIVLNLILLGTVFLKKEM